MSELDKQSYLLGIVDGREQGINEGTIRGLQLFERAITLKIIEHANQGHKSLATNWLINTIADTTEYFATQYEDKK